MMTSGTYDEALERFHRYGPEFDGWLSNHGPMAVEALARRGDERVVHAWTDRYLARLDARPRGITPILAEEWRAALGDATRSGDWIDHMLREVHAMPWREVLHRWWPRLVPGVAAGATHGVIRVGHAVQALALEETGPRIDELAHALAYWAARWQPLPTTVPGGQLTITHALPRVPRVAQQEGGIRHRLDQLSSTPGWASSVDAAALDRPGDQARALLDEIVDVAVERYVGWGHGSPTMLVHAATAPAAIARVIPELPVALHPDAVAAAWAATCAVVAAYRPAVDGPAPQVGERTSSDVWEEAVAHGGEHVIKFADVAVASYGRTASAAALSAAVLAVEMDA